MIAVIQRVSSASVEVDNKIVGEIGKGMVVLLGVAKGDIESDSDYLAEKILNLRIFEDDAGKMNRSLLDIKGEALIVSQFTLLGDTKKGRRPGFDLASPPDLAESFYERFIAKIRNSGIKVSKGVFGAKMLVKINNDGPVTFIAESKSHP